MQIIVENKSESIPFDLFNKRNLFKTTCLGPESCMKNRGYAKATKIAGERSGINKFYFK